MERHVIKNYIALYVIKLRCVIFFFYIDRRVHYFAESFYACHSALELLCKLYYSSYIIQNGIRTALGRS